MASFSGERAIEALVAARSDDQVCISTMMSARVWPALSQHPLDFPYLSSTMGGAIPLGLGVALARPDCEVMVLSGDGALLMSLGCLVTVAASGARNLTVVVLDNGRYELTGGQATPGRIARVDYPALARGAGFPIAVSCPDLDSWRAWLRSGGNQAGPRLVALRVEPVSAETPRCTRSNVGESLRRLAENLSARPVGRKG